MRMNPLVTFLDVSGASTTNARAPDVTALVSLRGAAFDAAFIELAVWQRRSIAGLAREVLARGSDASVAALARRVVELQMTELVLLERWDRGTP
jgi:hypothetical protein